MASHHLFPTIRHPHHGSNRDVGRLQTQMERVFEDFFSEPTAELATLHGADFVPACDVEERDKDFLLHFDLPGMKKDEVKIEVHGNQLIVSGERKREHKEDEKGRFTHERYYGSFLRTFTMPSNIESEKVQADLEDGVLHVVIPKSEFKPKQVSVGEKKRLGGKGEKAA